jgi:hypothetical protein
MTKRQTSTATLIREKIEKNGKGYWRYTDFADLPAAAVSKTLSRLVNDGSLERISKGLYYHSHKTRFGQSKPSQAEIQNLPTRQTLRPAGLSAANLLGFTTQNAVQGEFATSANSAPRRIIGDRARLHTRRPSTWNRLSVEDTAILDFLRRRGNLSELSPEKTTERILDYFRERGRFERLLAVAEEEPPRVRAMLGAIGQELGQSRAKLKQLRNTLNPVSRFDFGVLHHLRYAKDWQAY